MKNKFIYNITAMDMKPQSFLKKKLHQSKLARQPLRKHVRAIFYSCKNDNFR